MKVFSLGYIFSQKFQFLSLALFFLISCDCADRPRGSDADCGVLWRLRHLQSENMRSASGEMVFHSRSDFLVKLHPDHVYFAVYFLPA